jgi:phosphoserine phosphatase
MFVATLIAADALRHESIAVLYDALAEAGCAPAEPTWLEVGTAADIDFFHDPEAALEEIRALIESGELAGVDYVVQPVAHREKRLLVADMDSTMITVECIDELADYAGIKAQIADVTERAMRGELDFAEALTARVALLKGLDDSVIDICRAERVVLTPGARTLIQTLRAQGVHTVLVSGGFTRFAEPVAAEIGFHRAIANVLELADGKLNGTVTFPIVDAERKRTELIAHATKLDIGLSETIAIGDGANDIPMIEAAGLGIAYHAKQKARDAADAAVNHGDLTTVLYMLGIPKAEWAKEQTGD